MTEPIRTKADYEAALVRINTLMDADPELSTPEGKELDILTDLVEHYEDKHVPSAPWKTGLVRDRHHLAYGVDHGVGLWAPGWSKRVIVTTWNWIACLLLGHDLLIQEEPNGPAHCVSCCRDLRVTNEPVLRVWEDDHDDDTSDAV